jgi:Zn-dependent protease
MKCQKCQKDVFLPFRCQYCGGSFCSEHRLPENHECSRIEFARTPKQEVQPIPVQRQKPYEYTVTYAPLQPVNRNIRFSRQEIRHLSIGGALVMSVGLSMGFLTNLFVTDYIALGIFTVILTASFFTHEMAHKIIAQREGFWAEFRLMLTGAMLTLLSVISPFFKIISPGAVMVAGFPDRNSNGKISVAGPATNILLSATLLATGFVPARYSVVFQLAAAFNAWIALFNLIPFGMLDGFKIFLWDKKIWALAFTASLALTIVSYGIVWSIL